MNPLELSGGGFDATFHALTVAADAWEPEDYVPEITQRVVCVCVCVLFPLEAVAQCMTGVASEEERTVSR